MQREVVLRWELQSGIVPLPRSRRPEHIRENLAVFDFELDDAQMKTIATLDCNGRKGPHPDEMNELV